MGDQNVVLSFPPSLLVDDAGVENELLMHYLYAVKDSVNRVSTAIDAVPDQVDVDKVRQDILKSLGTTIGINVDDSEPVGFQRSLVGQAVQFYRIKGTDTAYKIRGKISGFGVEMINLYALAPIWVPYFSIDNLFELPAGSGNFYTDSPPGSVSGTPTEIGCDYCLTAYIKIDFTIVKTLPPAISGAPNFFDRMISKLREVVPIHVRDILYEIKAFILADEHQYLAVPLDLREDTFTPCSMWHHFDAIPADCVPCDARGNINGTSELV